MKLKNIWKRAPIIMLVLLGILNCGPIMGESHDKNVNNSEDTVILMKAAENKEFAKVIVQLKVPEIEELKSSAAQADNATRRMQIEREISRRIAEVADSVLSQIKDTRHKVNRWYHSLPLIAMDVSPEALVILKSSPHVLNITEDKLAPLN